MRTVFVFLSLFTLMYFDAKAQKLSFNKVNFNTVFQKIEQQSELNLNYNPELVSGFSFSGEIDLAAPEKMMEQILEPTPFEFKIEGFYILVFLPPKKNYNFCGFINDANGNPVEGASIFLQASNKGITSNENGFFRFTAEAQRNEKIIISHLGFENMGIDVTKWKDNACPTFSLKQNTYELGVITVDYILEGISEGADYGSVSINSYAFFKNYSVQEYDVLKMAQLLPGVSSIDESASNLTIRGATPDQNLILWEGATLYSPGHVFGMVSTINPFIVNKIKVYKSAYNPIYQNRIGGIVDVSLPNKITNRIKGGIGTTLSEMSANVYVPLIKNKLAILASGRSTTNRFVKSPLLSNYSDKIFSTEVIGEESSSTNLGFKQGDDRLKFYDINTKIMYQPTENILAEVSYFNSNNNMSFVSAAASDDITSNEWVEYGNQALSARLAVDWNTAISSKIFFNQSKYNNQNQSTFSNSSENGLSSDSEGSNNVNDIQLGITNNFQLSKTIDLDLGYSAGFQKVDYFLSQSVQTDSDLSTINKTQANFHNLVGSVNFKYKKFLLNTGLRGTYYNEMSKFYISPRMNFQYLFNKELKFKLSAGNFHQFLTQLENVGNITLNAQNNIWILSNNETGEQLNAKKIAAGVIFKPNNWLFDIEWFYHKSKGISSLSSNLATGFLIEGNGESDVFGVDVLVKRSWKNYRFWLNYSLSKNTYHFPSLNYHKFPANNDQRHNLSLYNLYKYKNWNFSLTYHFKSGLPYSYPSGIEKITPEDGGTAIDRLVYDKINSKRLDYYSRCDASINYKTKIARDKINLELGCSLLNVFNRANVFSKDYFIGDRESEEDLKIVSMEKYQLKRTPQILIRISF